MKKSLFNYLTLIAILLAVLLVTASLALVFVGNVGDSSLPVDADADAAITAATSFSRFSNGIQYYYTNPTANSTTTITVVHTDTWGSQKNPFVINTKEQWVYFVNVITAKNSTYHGTGKYFVLGNDLNFGNETINPVGVTTDGFKGILYGNKHTLSNVKLAAVTDPIATSQRAGGFFYYINGGSVYDLTIASNCTFNYATNYATLAGTLTARSANATYCNVISNANITVNNSGNTTNASLGLWVGGLVGYNYGASLAFYKCSYVGTITVTPFGSAITASGNDCHKVGGLLGGGISGITAFTVDACYVKANLTYHGGGINVGGLFGNLGGPAENTCLIKLTNNVVRIVYTEDGVIQSHDIAGLGNMGANVSFKTGSTVSGIYLHWTGALTARFVGSWNGAESTGTTLSNNVANVTIGTATVNATPESAAASNSGVTNYWTISGTTVTTKLNSSFNIQYDLAGGS
ncbi:MAG: hypothetical protein NC099_06455, partial [Corallococcus sp.]|nr:hypothetical protein [Bacillota bacterium]MCM1534272.1 hypothetical protein [Corallococcus sp.]